MVYRRRRRGGENSLLNVSDALAVSPFIFVLMFLIPHVSCAALMVLELLLGAFGYIKICVLNRKPEPLARMSKRALSVVKWLSGGIKILA